jgi:hypothetical protein
MEMGELGEAVPINTGRSAVVTESLYVQTGDVEAFLLLMGMWFMIAVAVGLRRHSAATPNDGATPWMAAAYAEPHQLVQVSAAAFPEADLEFYDRARRELEEAGFRWIADLEDLSLTRLSPETRTFMRVFLDRGGMIRGAVYHVRPRGLVVLLQAVLRIPRELRVIELVTEFGGQFLSTSNTRNLDRLDAPPEVISERLPPSTPLSQVIARHGQRIAERVRSNPEKIPIHFETLEDVLASVARGNQIIGKFWRQRSANVDRPQS